MARTTPVRSSGFSIVRHKQQLQPLLRVADQQHWRAFFFHNATRRRRNSAPPCLTSVSQFTYLSMYLDGYGYDDDDDAHAVPSNCNIATAPTSGSCLLRYQHLLSRSLQLFSTQRIDSRRAGWHGMGWDGMAEQKSWRRTWMCVETCVPSQIHPDNGKMRYLAQSIDDSDPPTICSNSKNTYFDIRGPQWRPCQTWTF